MKKFIHCLLMGCWILAAGTTSAQQASRVQGTVTATGSGEKLANVTVTLKGGPSVVTNKEGKYSITIKGPEGTLVFSSIGFRMQEVPLSGRTTIDVSLEQDATSLNDVVVVGYAQQSRNKTSAAISKLAPEELQNRPNPNPVQALQGKVAGVSVPIANGQPGSGATNILIRGGTKLNAYGTGLGTKDGDAYSSVDNSSPLVVIDGVFRSLNDINPDDIESLQVMKDAASTAIYGARGANGVIVIKTRTGKFNSRPTVTFNYRMTWETKARDYNYLSAKDYLTLARTTVQNTADPLPKDNLLNKGLFSAGTTVFTQKGEYGKSINLTALYDNIVAIEGQAYVDDLLSKGWEVMDDPINPGTKLLFKDNNYQDEIWKTGLTHNYNASITGGGDKASYNVSLGYINQAGVLIGTQYERYNALGNFNFKVSDNFRLEASLNYQHVLPNYVESFQNELVRGTRITPLIRIFKDDGDPLFGEVPTTRNRFHTLKYDDTRVSTERMLARLAGDWTLLKGLHFRPSVSYLMDDYRSMLFRKAFPGPVQFTTQRQKNEYVNLYRQLMIDQVLQYDYTLNSAHNFTVLAGFNYTRETRNSMDMGSQRASNDYIYTIDEDPVTSVNGGLVSNVTNFKTGLTENKSASFFGQLNYDFDNKYLVSAALRYDGFSHFAPDNKYALFPSFSAGWNVHQEKFWNVRFMNALKLRASWGQAGSRDLELKDTYGNYKIVSYGQNTGILRDNLSNANLRWETTQTIDLAFDAAFFQNRINLTVDFYNKLTKDRLDYKPLPLEAPFSTIRFNNGVLQNKGVEIELSATVLRKKDFMWRTSFSFAYNKQMVKELPANGRAKNRQNGDIVYDPGSKAEKEVGGFAEGERPYGLWAFQVEGIFATDEEAKAWGKQDQMASVQGQRVGKHAGDYKWADLNNDNIIDKRDMVFMGYRTPDKIGGMQNTFTWKDITLRVAVDYALGHVISNGALARSLGQGRAYNEGAPAEALGDDIWQKAGDVDKRYARFSFADYDLGQRNYIRQVTSIGTGNSYGVDVSTMFDKGDFMAIREIYIAYELPKTLLSKAHISGCSVFASVYNVGYITGYKGVNPETYSGFDAIGYPRPRQFSLGATVRF